MQRSNFFPMNDSILDSNVRGESPIGFCLYEGIVPGSLTAGAITLTLKAPFGKGLGRVIGGQMLNNSGGAAVAGFTPDLNPILAISAVIGTSAEGDILVTITTSDATVTSNSLVVSFLVWGQVYPVNT